MSQLINRIARVIEDPGAIVPRNGESASRWAARAVLTVLEELADEVHGRPGPLALALFALVVFAAGLGLGSVLL